MVESIAKKLEKLKEILKSYGKICIGFSGGVDSTLLLRVASDVSKDNFGIFVNSDFICSGDCKEVEEFSKTMNIHTVSVDILQISEVAENPKIRCKHCKKEIFSLVLKKGRELGGEVFCDGLNIDDLSEYRPGIEATDALGVCHPFVEAKITKSEIYQLAEHYNLSNRKKLSNSCLATRIPTGKKIKKSDLLQVEYCEEQLAKMGFVGSRVRCHDTMLVVELRTLEGINCESLEKIQQKFSKFGKKVMLDIACYKKQTIEV